VSRKGSRRIVLGHGVSSGVLIDQVEHSMQKERVLPGKVSFELLAKGFLRRTEAFR
jgi:hypothetical protein